MAQKKPNWNFAPPDAEAGCAEGLQNFAAWYKRDGKGAVWQICEAAGARKWTWMGGRVDFPIPHELRPAAFPLNNGNSVSRSDLVFAALVDCVAVMEQDLNGLAMIQPELKQAKQAIDAYQVVDAEFVEWNGEGLPPVGTVCEIKDKAEYDRSEWEPVEIKYLSSVTVVALRLQKERGLNTEILIHPHNAAFRPIRTPEQIEAEERDRQAKEMFDLLNPGEELGRNFFRRLYDKGFRKQVTP